MYRISGGIRAIRLNLLLFDPVVDFFPVHGDILWSINTDSDLVTFDTEDGDSHFIPDHQGLSNPAR